MIDCFSIHVSRFVAHNCRHDRVTVQSDICHLHYHVIRKSVVNIFFVHKKVDLFHHRFDQSIRPDTEKVLQISFSKRFLLQKKNPKQAFKIIVAE